LKSATLILAALILPALIDSASAADTDRVRGRYQSCSGTLIVSEGEYQLKPDAGSGLWCDAIISTGEYIGGANLVPKVLKVCAVGNRCRIKGTYEGHGVFYWNKILEVRP
jgi:hypothetical protein